MIARIWRGVVVHHPDDDRHHVERDETVSHFEVADEIEPPG